MASVEPRCIKYEYPLREVNYGTMLGNGSIGLFVWGEGNVFNITVGCSNLWDHRGGTEWRPEQNFANIREALYNRDEARLKDLFKYELEPGVPTRPSLIPVGRIRLTLKKGFHLYANSLDVVTGCLNIYYGERPYNYESSLRNEECGTLVLDMAQDVFQLKCSNIESCEIIPAYDLSEDLNERGFVAPERISMKNLNGFIQKMPVDDDYALAVNRNRNSFTCAFMRNASLEALYDLTHKVSISSDSFWRHFWDRVPVVTFEEEELTRLYNEYMFKFESMTHADAHSVPAGLQGPWIEDDKLPPWSGDFHFNINVQMCYLPALRAGCWDNLRKLFDMVWSWRDELRENARKFAGIDNGYMLPHAVDDRCRCMGGFWTGTIDHGCTAWVAQMMFDYVIYSGNMEFLTNTAFDFMKGAFNVYYAMMEKDKQGTLHLPVTTSPEFGGSRPDAWGRDASFQLAACHRLVLNLLEAARMLGGDVDKRWVEVENCLPQACLLPQRIDWDDYGVKEPEGQKEIGLFDGKYLSCSHRHHSHLAGIYPFCTLSPDNEQWRDIIANSVARWQGKGMGLWTGWCMTWAASILVRLGKPEAVRSIFDIWHRNFVNKGGCSTHDAVSKGVFTFSNRPDIIQLDATMGALGVLQDMVLYEQDGIVHLFRGVAGHVVFENMFAPGGFEISGCTVPFIEDGQEKQCCVTIRATRGGSLKLKLHTGGQNVEMRQGAKIIKQANIDDILKLQFELNQKITIVVS